jgi:hypothetical protein
MFTCETRFPMRTKRGCCPFFEVKAWHPCFTDDCLQGSLWVACSRVFGSRYAQLLPPDPSVDRIWQPTPCAWMLPFSNESRQIRKAKPQQVLAVRPKWPKARCALQRTSHVILMNGRGCSWQRKAHPALNQPAVPWPWPVWTAPAARAPQMRNVRRGNSVFWTIACAKSLSNVVPAKTATMATSAS